MHYPRLHAALCAALLFASGGHAAAAVDPARQSAPADGWASQAGGTVEALDVKADVSLGPDSAGGFKLTGIALTVRGEVSGIDEAQFQAAAKDAKETCPVSKALTGVEITLDATFES